MALIVSKFGGTSMGDAKCMLRSAEVSVQQKSSLICVSAVSGVTNQLIQIGQVAATGVWDHVVPLIDQIKQQHLSLARELDFKDQDNLIQNLFTEMESVARGISLLKDSSPRALDLLVGLGERLSSVLFTQALNVVLGRHKSHLNVQLFDAREVIVTSDRFGQARPFIDAIAAKAKQKLLSQIDFEKTIVVTQGFIGQTEQGLSTTLGRGGSDYSAALFAEAIGADILEIWTDVPGIATTDPRICKEAVSLAEVSFKEASEMAVFGAKVLHPATVEPAMRKNIPVFVGSSFDSQKKGTWVKKEVSSQPLIRALALRRQQTLVTISTPEMLQAHGFLFKIFKVFNDHQISIDAITTSEISVAVTIDGQVQLYQKLIQDLSAFAEVKIEEGLHLVSIIGNNIHHTPGLAKRVFTAIADINVRMICLGASRHNFCFLVDSHQGETAIQKLHREFELHL